MIAVDSNVLVHGHQREAALHERAVTTLVPLAESPRPWGIPLHCLVEFYGVVTQPRLWTEPSSPSQAFAQIAAWRESPGCRVLSDKAAMFAILEGLAIEGEVRGAKIHDARIAACCQAHGVTELWTVDRDFSRFPGLKTRNPLVAPS